MTEKVKVPVWFDEWYRSLKGSTDLSIKEQAIMQLSMQGWGFNFGYSLGDNKHFSPTENQKNYVSAKRLKLIEAVINGYEVEEQKFVLPMEGTSGDDTISNGVLYAFKGKSTGRWCTTIPLTSLTEVEVTKSQLDKAPAWVKAIKPVPAEEAEEDD